MRYASGSFTRIDPPGAIGAAATGNNDAGDIVGSVSDDQGNSGQSFLFTAGRFSILSAPGALYTGIRDINNVGQIVGVADVPGGQFSF